MQACFYDYVDIEDFKSDARRVAKMIENEEDIDESIGEECCRRGSEHMTKEAARRRKERKSAAISVVLDEQFWSDEDSSAIAASYFKAVQESATSARMIGLSDASVAKSINPPNSSALLPPVQDTLKPFDYDEKSVSTASTGSLSLSSHSRGECSCNKGMGRKGGPPKKFSIAPTLLFRRNKTRNILSFQ